VLLELSFINGPIVGGEDRPRTLSLGRIFFFFFFFFSLFGFLTPLRLRLSMLRVAEISSTGFSELIETIAAGEEV
jgi:hypothetical protein